MEREQTFALLGISLSHFLSHAFIVSVPVLIPFLNLDFAAGGILAGVLFVSYGLTQLPSGWISDKIGERLVLLNYLIVSALGSVAMVLIDSFTLVLLISGAIGLAGGLYHPVGLSLVSKVFEEKRGQAMGIHGVAGNVGLAVAPPITAIVAVTFHWNFALLPIGFLAFFVSLIFLFSRSWFENDNSIDLAEEISSVVKICPKPISKYLAFVLILSACNGIIFDGVNAFMFTYLVYTRNFTEVYAGYITGFLIFAVGIASQLVFGFLVDKQGTYKTMLLSFFLLFITIGLVPFSYGGLFLILLPFLGFALVSAQPGLNTMVAEASTEEKRGLAYGLNFFMNYGIGGLATPFVGYIADTYTADCIFYVLVGVVLLGFLVLLRLISRKTT
ncbi:MAG: MFS transporter [Candidatus Heimdallarchaeota archaeon]